MELQVFLPPIQQTEIIATDHLAPLHTVLKTEPRENMHARQAIYQLTYILTSENILYIASFLRKFKVENLFIIITKWHSI